MLQTGIADGTLSYVRIASRFSDMSPRLVRSNTISISMKLDSTVGIQTSMGTYV